MSFGDQKDIDAFKEGTNAFMSDPALANTGGRFDSMDGQSLASVVPNNNSGSDRTVFQQLDAGNPVNRSVANIQINTSLSAKKAVTNGAEAAKSLSAGKQEVAATAAAMKEDWAANKAEAMDCLKEAANNQGFDGDAVVAQISSSPSDSGLGSLVTANSGGGSIGFEPSKQDKKLKPDELKSLIADTVKVAQSGGAQDTRATVNNSGGEVIPKGDIAKLDENSMEQLLTQDITDQPEYKAALDVGHALDEVADNHMFVSSNYNPTDVAEAKYDSIDVDLAGQSLQGVSTIPVDSNTVAANAAFFNADISDISSKIKRADFGDDAPIYKPPQATLDKMLGLG